MSWPETVRTAWEALAGRRSRSGLTVLGILIGIAAVILTVGLGEGAQARVGHAIASLGTNLLIVTPGSATASGLRGGLGSASTLTLGDARALQSHLDCPDIAAVAPVVQRSFGLAAGSNTWTAPVLGTTPAYLPIRNRSVVAGAGLTAADVTTGASVAVIGSQVATSLFPSGRAVGRTIQVGGVPFTVVGVLNTAGATANANQDDLVLVPITTAQQQLIGRSGPQAGSLSQILLSARSPQAMGAAYQETQDLLLQLHHIPSPAQADFTVTPQTALLSTASSVSGTLTVLLVGIAAISLLVGGIGVMNIMLVSVTERIREIGVRKALGGTPSDIRRQFLVEASGLGLAGGLGGALLGLAGALVLPQVIGNPVDISWPAVAGSIVVAVGIGVVFGVYPASRAARLAPIDALRSD